MRPRPKQLSPNQRLERVASLLSKAFLEVAVQGVPSDEEPRLPPPNARLEMPAGEVTRR